MKNAMGREEFIRKFLSIYWNLRHLEGVNINGFEKLIQMSKFQEALRDDNLWEYLVKLEANKLYEKSTTRHEVRFDASCLIGKENE